MDVTLAKRSGRPWWMTPFGREPLGDIFFDRLWPEWKRDMGEELNPSVDLVEKDNKYELTVELPGLEKDDISISVENGYVTISGKREDRSEKEEGEYYVKEMRYGSFRRSFRLPKNVMDDKVEATYKNGLLTVVIPLAEGEKTRKITIH
jgi:HSP20 family protein